MDIERIIRFCVVAEEMSFTKAAKRLNVDQPWLSRQILQLEEQLGFRLFERTTRKISLTPEGEMFLKQAARLAEEAQKTQTVARAISGEIRHRLRIGVSQASFWIPEREALFSQFKAKFPSFHLEMTTNFSPRMVSNLEERKIDLAMTTPIAPSPKLDYHVIHRSVPGILFPAEMQLAQKNEIHMTDLAGLQLGVPVRRANPISFDNQYQPFLDAGMVPRVVPEGRLAIYHYAALERMPMLGYQGEIVSDARGFVYREIAGCTAKVEIGVVRLKDDDRAGVERFWKLVLKFGA